MAKQPGSRMKKFQEAVILILIGALFLLVRQATITEVPKDHQINGTTCYNIKTLYRPTHIFQKLPDGSVKFYGQSIPDGVHFQSDGSVIVNSSDIHFGKFSLAKNTWLVHLGSTPDLYLNYGDLKFTDQPCA